MLRSQVAVLTGKAMCPIHNLNSSWNTSLNGSMIFVSSTILEGICSPDVDISARYKCIKSLQSCQIIEKNPNKTRVANGTAVVQSRVATATPGHPLDMPLCVCVYVCARWCLSMQKSFYRDFSK